MSDGRCGFSFADGAPSDEYSEWRCPHPAHDDEDRCLFHLSPAERAEQGITDDEVSQAFVDRVRDNGRQSKEFVGAHFQNLIVDHRVIEAEDRFPIDLSHTTITGSLDLRESTINQPIYLEECEINHLVGFKTQFSSTVDLAGATVKNITMTRSRFQDEVTFHAAIVEDRVDLSESIFDYRCDFTETSIHCDFVAREVRFNHDASFTACEVQADLICEGAEFNGGAKVMKDDADFANVTVEGNVDFSQTEFRRGRFDGASFQGNVDLSHSLFEAGASLNDTTIEGDADLEHASFQLRTDMADLEISGDIDFHFTGFQSRVTFDYAEFHGISCFREADFEGDASFESTIFHEEAVFAGASFEGGAEIERDDAKFVGAEFRDGADFTQTQFRYANFRGTVCEGHLDLEEAHVESRLTLQDARIEGTLDLEHATLDDRVDLDDLSVNGAFRFIEVEVDGDFSVRGGVVEDDADFTGTEFNGGSRVQDRDADFENARFEGSVTFDHADFRKAHFEAMDIGGDISFHHTYVDHNCSFEDITVGGETSIVEARFGERCQLEGATFNDEVIIDEGEFHGRTDFRDAQFTADLDVIECIYDDDLLFTEAEIEGDTTFRGVEFHGGANVKIEDANFTDTVFHGPATFESVQFRSATFEGAIFTDELRFTDSEFDLDVSFHDTGLAPYTDFAAVEVRGAIDIKPDVETDVLVDFENSYVRRGRLSQPENASAYYDCTEATIGDVDLVASSSEKDGHLMEKFLFKNTDFERFDFSGIRDYLTKNHWVIHSLDLDKNHDLRKYLAPSFEDDELETTYLKAKNSASAVGDNKAASEFYIKETAYRRRQYKELLLPSTDSRSGLARSMAGPIMNPFRWSWQRLNRTRGAIAARIPVPFKSVARYVANLFFFATCGYGERPSRVVISSIVITSLFFGIYAGLDVNLQNEGLLAHFVYSAQAFVSLIIGTPEGSTMLINLVTAVEAFTGAFFIALFVFTLTRSMHR